METNNLINVDNQPIQYQPSDEVLSQLQALPKANEAASKLLAQVDLDELDETEITNMQSQFREFSKLKNKIDQAIKSTKQQLKVTQVDKPAQQFIKYLNDNFGYAKANENYTKITEFNKEILNNRGNQRWEQLKPLFEKNLELYPIIGQVAPKLTDFSYFRVLNPKLVSNAKTQTVLTKKQTYKAKYLEFINNQLKDWADNLTLISENPYQLSDLAIHELIERFADDPNQFNNSGLTNEMKTIQENLKAKEEAAKVEAERLKQLQTQNDQKLVNQAKSAMETSNQSKTNEAQTNASTEDLQSKTKPKLANQEFEWLQPILNNVRFKNIHHNAEVKNDLIASMYHDLAIKPDTGFFAKHTNNDARQILKVVMYILYL